MKLARDPAEAKALATARGLTLRQIGRLVGCSHQTVANALAGAPVGDQTARDIARVLHLRVDDLFVDAPRDKDTPRR